MTAEFTYSTLCRTVWGTKHKDLFNALEALRAYDALRRDLAYLDGDARSEIPLGEMPGYWLDGLVDLQSRVTYCAARLTGETQRVASFYADTPTHRSNPYSVDRVQKATRIMGWGVMSRQPVTYYRSLGELESLRGGSL